MPVRRPVEAPQPQPRCEGARGPPRDGRAAGTLLHVYIASLLPIAFASDYAYANAYTYTYAYAYA